MIKFLIVAMIVIICSGIIAYIALSQRIEQRLGAAAFPAASEYATTTGWADDGSIVRLDNASDTTGIGSTSPSEKLGISGSAIIEEDSATSTLFLSTDSDTIGSCIEMKGSNGTRFRIYAAATTSNTGRLIVENGRCQN